MNTSPETVLIAGLLCAVNPKDDNSVVVSVEKVKGKAGRPKGAKNKIDPIEKLKDEDYSMYLVALVDQKFPMNVEIVSKSWSPPFGYNKDGSIAQKRGRKATIEGEDIPSVKISSGQKGRYAMSKTLLKPVDCDKFIGELGQQQ